MVGHGAPWLPAPADGSSWTDSGARATLKFGSWKGARIALFAYGDGQGAADFDEVRYRHSATAAALKADQPSSTRRSRRTASVISSASVPPYPSTRPRRMTRPA